MVEEGPNIVLEYLRRIDRKLDAVVEEMQSMNRRVALTETNVATLFSGGVVAQEELDRLKSRVTRIERRLDMVER